MWVETKKQSEISKLLLGSLYNYDDAIDGRVGTNYYDFYSVSVGHYLLTGKTK